jgi:hypothetical protein
MDPETTGLKACGRSCRGGRSRKLSLPGWGPGRPSRLRRGVASIDTASTRHRPQPGQDGPPRPAGSPAIHKTTTPPAWNGHAALGGRQQHRSNIRDRAAPPLFRVGSRVAKCSTCWSKPCPGRLGVAGQGIFAMRSPYSAFPPGRPLTSRRHQNAQAGRFRVRAWYPR